MHRRAAQAARVLAAALARAEIDGLRTNRDFLVGCCGSRRSSPASSTPASSTRHDLAGRRSTTRSRCAGPRWRQRSPTPPGTAHRRVHGASRRVAQPALAAQARRYTDAGGGEPQVRYRFDRGAAAAARGRRHHVVRRRREQVVLRDRRLSIRPCDVARVRRRTVSWTPRRASALLRGRPLPGAAAGAAARRRCSRRCRAR